MDRFRVLVPVVLTVAALAFLAWASLRAAQDGFAVVAVADFDWRWALAAFAFMVAFFAIYALCWFLLLRALNSQHVPFGRTMRLFVLTWPGRYVPGSLAYHGGRVMAAQQLGISRSCVAASLFYENVILVASTAVVAGLCIAISVQGRFSLTPMMLAVVATSAGCALLLQPSVMRRGTRYFAGKHQRLRMVEDFILTYRQIVPVAVLYAVGAIFVGAAYYSALRGIGIHTSPFMAIGAYNVAGIAGMLAIAVPGGLGVREGTVVALLASSVAAPAALNGAVLVRVLGIAADVLPLLSYLTFTLTARVACNARFGNGGAEHGEPYRTIS